MSPLEPLATAPQPAPAHAVPIPPAPPSTPQKAPSPALGDPAPDPRDPAAGDWFLKPTEVAHCDKTTCWNQVVRSDNEIIPYIHSWVLWNAMKDEIINTADASHFIYLAGRDVKIDLDLAQGSGRRVTLEALLKARPNVQVRALLPPSADGKGANRIAVNFINTLPNGVAIEDSRSPVGHHQKVLVVSGTQGTVAFCGGIDLFPDRGAWHDVHCRIRGPATEDLHRNFIERWLDHPAVKALTAKQRAVVSPVAGTPRGDKLVQVVRTFGAGAPGGPYCFAPKGERTIYNLLAHAIKRAERFIYVEDQYLVAYTPMRAGPSIAQLLHDRLSQSPALKLIILIARTEPLNVDGEFARPAQGWKRRREFIDALGSPRNVTICTYKPDDPDKQIDYVNPPLVHSKTWIFDDRFAVIGSANCDRRGYTANSEASVGIADPNSRGDRLSFAHKLRIDLWLKHLNPRRGDRLFSSKNVEDPLGAAAYWERPLAASPIERYNPYGDHVLTKPNLGACDVVGSNLDAVWNGFDQDGSA